MQTYFKTNSTPFPICSWTVGFLYFSNVSHTQFIDSVELTLSKMPSHPRRKKSQVSSIKKVSISGSAITTLGFPPNFGSLASMSPNVRETESLPGNTLKGPRIV